MSIRLMMAAFFAVMLATLPARSQSIITFVTDTPDLTPGQSLALDGINQSKTTGSVDLVTIDTARIVEGSNVEFDLPEGKFSAMRNFGERSGPRSATWIGEIQQQLGGTATFAVDGDAVTATIETPTDLYRIRPLGGGLHALVKEDPSGLPPEHPPEQQNFNPGDQPDLPPVDPRDLRDAADTTIETIDVFVAFTPAARDAVSNIASFAGLAVAESNQSYVNSGIAVRQRLVGTAVLDYQESGNFQTDLNRLRSKSDGFMDDIHALRDQAKADVVVLINDNDQFCGLASVYAAQDRAFAVVWQNCATGYYSFAHEIGHLFGAVHNPEAGGGGGPFAYGHGWINPAKQVRTIMAYQCPATSCRRVPQWSRPPEWGDSVKHHDARVMQEVSRRVAAFR